MLLKESEGSAVESMRHRASVWTGKRGGRESRAWRAESLAEDVARLGGGDGRFRSSSSESCVGIAVSKSSWDANCATEEAEDWRRVVRVRGCWRQHGLVRGERTEPLQR